MNVKKNTKRKNELQKNIIDRQSKQINVLKEKIEDLEEQLQRKDEIINSVAHLKEELSQNLEEVKKHRKEYGNLVKELRMMKEILNQEVYKGKWKLVKFLIK